VVRPLRAAAAARRRCRRYWMASAHFGTPLRRSRRPAAALEPPARLTAEEASIWQRWSSLRSGWFAGSEAALETLCRAMPPSADWPHCWQENPGDENFPRACSRASIAPRRCWSPIWRANYV
jgi:hypothetical protein